MAVFCDLMLMKVFTDPWALANTISWLAAGASVCILVTLAINAHNKKRRKPHLRLV